jgi:predicted secreted protein
MRRGGSPMRIAGVLLFVVLSAAQAQAQMKGDAATRGTPAWRQQRDNIVELQAEAQREVPNDTLTAQLYVEATDAVAAQVSNTLNRTINEALKIAVDSKTVRVRSGNSQTYPVNDRNQKLTGWRGRSELRLETRDFQAGAALIGKLQSTLQLSGMSFSVSAEARRAAENELITEAVAAFRARADIVRQALGGSSYRVRNMSISSGGFVPPRPVLMRAMSAASAEVAAPQLEGGLSQVTVSVSGAIAVE